ncbi:TPA: hypothetical protein NGT97_001351 [Vibrio parahaemolyticus]|nr:hypothetical protein [Vibrio parahaemolyticus]
MVEVQRATKNVPGPTGSFKSGRTSGRTQSSSMNAYPDEGWLIDTGSVEYKWNGSDHCSGGRTHCTGGTSETLATQNCTIASEKGVGAKKHVHMPWKLNFLSTSWKNRSLNTNLNCWRLPMINL